MGVSAEGGVAVLFPYLSYSVCADGPGLAGVAERLEIIRISILPFADARVENGT